MYYRETYKRLEKNSSGLRNFIRPIFRIEMGCHSFNFIEECAKIVFLRKYFLDKVPQIVPNEEYDRITTSEHDVEGSNYY